MWTERPILSFSLSRGFSNISAMTSVTSPFAIVRSASFSLAEGIATLRVDDAQAEVLSKAIAVAKSVAVTLEGYALTPVLATNEDGTTAQRRGKNGDALFRLHPRSQEPSIKRAVVKTTIDL